MYKRKSVKKLGRTHSHRKSLVQNLLRSVLTSGKVKTSSVRAKVLKGELESLISSVKNSKDGDISLIRKLNQVLGKKDLVKKIFEIAKKEGTKVSIKKTGYRIGDNTEISLVEIVGFKAKEASKKKTTKKEGKADAKIEGKKEDEIETKEAEEKKKSILNIGRKTVSKKVDNVKRERARTRSGL